jgi:hypothetical protein
MEKINQLLEKLNYKLPISLSKKFNKLKSLKLEVEKQEKEHLENDDDDSKNALTEIMEFYNEECEELQHNLEELVNKKQQEENKAKAEAEAENRAKKQVEYKAKREAEKLEAEKLEAEKLEAEKLEAEKLEEEKNLKTEKEKKSGIGLTSLLIGGALLIVSAGAINYFGKKN